MAGLSPAQQLAEARQMARAHGMFVVEKPGKGATDYLLYRCTAGGNQRIGRRRDIAAFRQLVARAARAT